MQNATPQDFESFFIGLSPEDRAALADEAGTSVDYIRGQLIAGRRLPRPRLIERLAAAVQRRGGRLSQAELITFFYRRRQGNAA